MNKLYKHTSLQATFGYNAVALVDNVPKTLSLLELTHYLDYQREIVIRRSKYELRKAEDRAHVLAGYLIALDNLDEVIRVIRGAADTDAAREQLMPVLVLRDPGDGDPRPAPARSHRAGAQARRGGVRRPAGADRRAARDPRRPGPRRRPDPRGAARAEDGVRKSDDRRTEIIAAEGEFSLEDMIAEEDMVIAITRSGYIKRLPVTSTASSRGGVGVMGMDLKDEDYIEHLFVASTHDYVLFFTTVGKVYRLKVHELPLGSRQSKGRRSSTCSVPPGRAGQGGDRDARLQGGEVPVLTKKGVVKKTEFLEYNTPLKADGIIAICCEDDELIGVRLSDGDDDVLMVSRGGQAIRFHERDVRGKARRRRASRAWARKEDEVIELDIAHDDTDLLVVTENGYGKRTRVSDYPVGPGRPRRQDDPAHRRARHARRRPRRPRRLPGDADLHRWHRDPDPVEEIKRLGRSTQGVIVMRACAATRRRSRASRRDGRRASDPPSTRPPPPSEAGSSRCGAGLR